MTIELPGLVWLIIGVYLLTAIAPIIQGVVDIGSYLIQKKDEREERKRKEQAERDGKPPPGSEKPKWP